MSTAFLTCCYPAAEPFIADFAASLARQSTRQFELYVINDGVDRPQRHFEGIGVPVHYLSASGSPACTRKAGIEWIASAGVRQVVFGDIDDYFAENRIEISLRLLGRHPVVFNELLLFGTGGNRYEPMFQDRLAEEEALSAPNIAACNCLGLSNTAADVALVQAAARGIPDDTIAFDWALFSRALVAGAEAVYTSATVTYYRQYGANIANPRALGDADIKRGVLVKSQHYRVLADRSEQFDYLARRFSELHQRILSDQAFASNYCSEVRALAPERALWWEPIRLPEEFAI